MTWPVIYLQLGQDEELFPISHDDWHCDVDAHWAIGRIPRDEHDHFLVDSRGDVFSLHMRREHPDGYPEFEYARVSRPDVIDVLRDRALRWSGLSEPDIAKIIEQVSRTSENQ